LRQLSGRLPVRDAGGPRRGRQAGVSGDEYRAGASIDLVHDRADLAQKVRVPMLVLWGMRSGQGSGYDVLKVWRDHADDVRGLGIDSGHFIPEEQPPLRNRKFADSPLEGTGFEPSVPLLRRVGAGR
jgi:pimeloyl-ACP methyl ester carboxylesterase